MIPERFVDRILRHAMSVCMIPTYPLLLAIQGPPGTGKSYQTYQVLHRANFEIFRVSAALLQGKHEGDSVEAFLTVYEPARECLLDPSRATPTIIIEDFDLSGAVRFNNTEYTVNQQLLVNHLMNLCDGIESDGTKAERIPIYLTGNNFSSLHEPLRRHGRLDVFTWQPNEQDQAMMLASILTGIANEPRVASDRLLAALPGSSIATLRLLIDQVASNYIYRQLKQVPQLGLAIWEQANYRAYRGVETDHLVHDMLVAHKSLDNAANFLEIANTGANV